MILTCVVTYNRLAYSQRCIGSLLATRRQQDRLIVVDNGSTDGTVPWLLSLTIPVLLNEDNRYPGAACNQGWDAGLERWSADLLHRSDNDIEYLPGWREEIENQFTFNPDLSLLGVLNLHEDLDIPFPGGVGIEIVERVGGNVVMPAGLFREGLRWDDGAWAPGAAEDWRMADAARCYGPVGRLLRTVANNMAFRRYSDFPEYYDETARVRGLGNAERTV